VPVDFCDPRTLEKMAAGGNHQGVVIETEPAGKLDLDGALARIKDPKKTVWGEVCDGQEEIFLGKQLIKSRVYLSRFNFKGSDQQKLVGELSGGERNRVHLAKLLKAGGNLILLDEPTNDLDVDTLRVLEEALAEFGGCVMIISHDRWFLDRIATHMISFEGDGTVRWFEGDYSAYEARRREELGDVYDRPHRSRYRKLTH